MNSFAVPEPESEPIPEPRHPGTTVLIVCEANVCRSPLIAFATARSWPVLADSAGINAAAGAPLCPHASAHISALGAGGRKYAADFRSHTVESMALEKYDLLLTATAELRGELVRRHPKYRDKSFTVLEALALFELPLSGAERLELQEHGPAPVLLGRRGSVPPSSARLRGKRTPSWDISDGHNERRNRHHLATVALAAKAGAELGVQLLDWRAEAAS